MDAMLSLFCDDIRDVTHNAQIHGESQDSGLKCTVSFLNPTIGMPHAPDPLVPSTYAPIRPHEARLCEKEYSMGLYVDVVQTVTNKRTGRIVKDLPPTIYRRVLLGSIPCMTGTRQCWQSVDFCADGASHAEPDGIFIVRKPRVMPPIDNPRSQYTHIYKGSKDNQRYVLEMRPIKYGSFRSTSTNWIYMMTNSLISFRPPFFNMSEIPIFIMFRLLGVETVTQAVRMIVSGGMLRGAEPIPQTSPWYDRAFADRVRWLLVHERGQSKFSLAAALKHEKEIPNVEGWDRDDVLDWVARMCAKEFRSKDRYDRIYSFKDIINQEVYPNVSREAHPTALIKKQ